MRLIADLFPRFSDSCAENVRSAIVDQTRAGQQSAPKAIGEPDQQNLLSWLSRGL